MLLKKTGIPETDEIVECTVTKVYYNSVFVVMDEYNKSGMIHISEISPGRIRNINDYVTVGKKVFCKVLRIDQVKGHIDLSLRRVNEGQRRKKVEDIKQEQKAEKVIEIVAKENKIPLDKFYREVRAKIAEGEYIHPLFQRSVMGSFNLEELGLNKNLTEALNTLIVQRFKPPKVLIGGDLELKSFAPNGVEVIKKAIQASLKKSNKTSSISYKGGGLYTVKVEDENYKSAEKVLKQMVDSAIKSMKEEGGEFHRREMKI